MKKFVAILAIFTTLFLGAMDLQTASKSELMEIKGVGDKKADAIIEYRKTNTIKSADDLKNIKGFGDSIINNVKNSVKEKPKKNKKDEKSKSEDNKESKKMKNSKSDN
ncbi:ComEA family DNA-binding protein [Aliarcobacter cryaerophilus]|uniref:Competence protein ComEA n=2 Tax=Aliarcobacter cryaerophilus TaxID=28198 RepID=A0A2S9SSE0_9BACT|nr:helix-hairpin-helix domain-containing protein [Aliarcobacter cryaerophilus]PRM89507.1 competence protein ComEA [Aliarcobacter cryaerophilus]PRM98264.1 competence protein ComEA [Arcobacter cryaerophilus gv. crypticus]